MDLVVTSLRRIRRVVLGVGMGFERRWTWGLPHGQGRLEGERWKILS
jgi:hypothetical protein